MEKRESSDPEKDQRKHDESQMIATTEQSFAVYAYEQEQKTNPDKNKSGSGKSPFLRKDRLSVFKDQIRTDERDEWDVGVIIAAQGGLNKISQRAKECQHEDNIK
jgi:hypothetical protein